MSQKRLAGELLNLSFDLFPAPDTQRFVRAFFFLANGSAHNPASVNMVDVGNGRFVENSTAMPSAEVLDVRFLVYTDNQYAELDCEYPGGNLRYELETLQPSQLPGAPELEAEIETVEIEAELESGELEAELESGEITAEVESETVDASLESVEVEAEAESVELEGEVDC